MSETTRKRRGRKDVGQNHGRETCCGRVVFGFLSANWEARATFVKFLRNIINPLRSKVGLPKKKKKHKKRNASDGEKEPGGVAF